jgi:dolichyl-phosphate-mannose--protein O-mannosyl transferase
LNRFNRLTFDEDYYVPHAYGYLTGQANFVQDLHPPLGRYMVTLGMWIDLHNPFTHTVKTLPSPVINNPDTFRAIFRKTPTLNAFTYRWMTAFCGACVPLVVAGIAYQLNRRRSFALIAGLLTALDGYLLVESRYALINMYIVLFGGLGHLFFLLALSSQPGQAARPGWRGVWLTLTSIAFAAAFSVKWSGLWLLLGVYWLLMAAWSIRLVEVIRNTPLSRPLSRYTLYAWLQQVMQALRATSIEERSPADHSPLEVRSPSPLHNLTQLSAWQVVYYLGLLPLLVYCLIWIPHLPLNEGLNLIQRHAEILRGQLMSSPGGHPNCSRWYTWPLLIWPVGYYWRHLHENTPAETVYIVQGYGNPILWWLSTLAIVAVIGQVGWRLWKWFTVKQTEEHQPRRSISQSVAFWSVLFIAINYAANLLPWTRVTRCTFLYHYLEAYLFAILAIAWFLDRLLRGRDRFLRIVGATTLLGIVAAFIFWSPIWLGLPLSAQQYEARIWLPTWDQGWVYLKNRQK